MHLIYLDTNIISLSLKEQSLHDGVRCLIEANSDARLVLSETHLVELCAADRQLDDLVEFAAKFGFILLKPSKHVIDEAVSTYPDPPQCSPFWNERPLAPDDVRTLFTAPRTLESREAMARSARQIPGRFALTKSNFRPARGGKYLAEQADEFAAKMLLEWLDDSNPTFAGSVRQSGHLETSLFASVLLHHYLVYWRYYLGKRSPPDTTSVLGDHAHARFYPHCQTIVVENDMCESLRQLKRSATHAAQILKGIEVMKAKDLRRLSAPRPS